MERLNVYTDNSIEISKIDERYEAHESPSRLWGDSNPGQI